MKTLYRNIAKKVKAFFQPSDHWFVKILKYLFLLVIGIAAFIVFYAVCLLLLLAWMMAIRQFHV